MPSSSSSQPSVRRLYPWEIEEARRVFGASLDFSRVWVHECTPWTNTLDEIGRRLKGMPSTGYDNAVTLGFHCYFPVKLPEQLPLPADPQYSKVGWLIHELTHAWQFQHLGWQYLAQAVLAQFRQKEAAYDFGDGEALRQRRQQGWTFQKFNLEQQGEIARTYYLRLKAGEDLSDWQPYIEDLRSLV